MTVFTVIALSILSMAALIYVVRSLYSAHIFLASQMADRFMRKMEKLHLHTFEEVSPTFELWWSEAASASVRQRVAESLELPLGIPQEVIDHLVRQRECQYRDEALHLAAHAFMEAEEQSLLNKLPSLFGIREAALKAQAAHEESLESARVALVSAGVDVDKLEKHFKPTV